MKAQTLKGFRDFLPQQAKKRQYVINTLRSVFESFGFEPLETPALEYEEVLLGKYGEEGDKLMYRFEDNGKRRVALRYDQTVPLARVVAEKGNELVMPFKRYQIQPVWRAENTQKGRYREFVQCDIDIVGVNPPLSDAEIIAATIDAYKKIGFKNFKVLLNDRNVFEGLTTQAVIIIDKLKKIGADGVCKELVEKNIAKDLEDAKNILQSITDKKPTERLEEIIKILANFGIEKSQIEFAPTLARGLDYYTGVIIEIECPDYPVGSLAGGGRYDNLIGMFTGNNIPAVGLAFGFDRTIEAMDSLDLFPKNITESSTKVLVTIFNAELKQKSLEIIALLRAQNIASEIYLDETAKMEKQLKYANAKQIPYVVVIGPEEVEKNVVTLKNMQTREQQQVSLETLKEKLS